MRELSIKERSMSYLICAICIATDKSRTEVADEACRLSENNDHESMRDALEHMYLSIQIS